MVGPTIWYKLFTGKERGFVDTNWIHNLFAFCNGFFMFQKKIKKIKLDL
jgi:hypothetical protein